MKKADIFLICAVVLFAIAVIAFLPLASAPKVAVVRHNGNIIDRLDLTTDTEKTYSFDSGYNTVVIKDKKVSVIAADCGGDCIKSGEQSLSGSSIVCLPHKFSVTLSGDHLDGVTR